MNNYIKIHSKYFLNIKYLGQPIVVFKLELGIVFTASKCRRHVPPTCPVRPLPWSGLLQISVSLVPEHIAVGGQTILLPNLHMLMDPHLLPSPLFAVRLRFFTRSRSIPLTMEKRVVPASERD